MKIKIYTNSTEKASELMNKVYEIVKEATGKEPNIRITNQSRLK